MHTETMYFVYFKISQSTKAFKGHYVTHVIPLIYNKRQQFNELYDFQFEDIIIALNHIVIIGYDYVVFLCVKLYS